MVLVGHFHWTWRYMYLILCWYELHRKFWDDLWSDRLNAWTFNQVSFYVEGFRHHRFTYRLLVCHYAWPSPRSITLSPMFHYTCLWRWSPYFRSLLVPCDVSRLPSNKARFRDKDQLSTMLSLKANNSYLTDKECCFTLDAKGKEFSCVSFSFLSFVFYYFPNYRLSASQLTSIRQYLDTNPFKLIYIFILQSLTATISSELFSASQSLLNCGGTYSLAHSVWLSK